MSARRLPAVMAVTAAVALGAFALAGPAQASASAHQKNVRTGTAYRGAISGKAPALAPSAALAVTQPKGYVVVNSGSLAAPASVQTHGSVTCPKGKVPLGGGAFFSSGSVVADINSSYPTATGWAADVNNGSTAASSFIVYATCSKKPGTSYAVVPGTVDDRQRRRAGVRRRHVQRRQARVRRTASPTRPAWRPISTPRIPVTNGWRSDANNGSALAETVTPYVVCANVTKYKIVIGTTTASNPGTQTAATAACTTAAPIGGGAFSSSGSTSVNLNTTYPVSGGWESFQNNNSTSATSFTPYAVCG